MISKIDIIDASTKECIVKQAIDENNNILGTLKADVAKNKIYSGAKFSPFYFSANTGAYRITKPHIYVSDLYVSKSARKQGIGKKLIHAIIKESQKLGLDGRVILLAGSNEGSPLPFYKKLGFITDNKNLNAVLDDCLERRIPFLSKEQAFMSLPKKVIAQILKSF